MPSQFQKRQKKTDTTQQEAAAPVGVLAEHTSVYTQTGYDIFTSDGGKNYGVAEIEYNPETKEAKVKEVFNISRLVALQFFNQKNALGTLKKKR